MEAPVRVFFRRLMRHRSGQIGLTGVILVFALAIFGPFLMTSSPTAVVAGQKLIGPSIAFPFGTDQLGRDVLTRVVYGAQLSLTLGLVPVFIAAVVGVPIGVLVGYAPRVDLILMRVMDVMMAIPALVFALAVIAVLGPGPQQRHAGPGDRLDPLLRADGAREREAGEGRTATWNTPSPRVRPTSGSCSSTSSRAWPRRSSSWSRSGSATRSCRARRSASSASAHRRRRPEWGAILRDGREFLRIAWWISVFPGLAIVFTVVSFNLLGDALRDTLDPRVRRGG